MRTTLISEHLVLCVLSRFSHVPLCAHQAPPSMGSSRQEYWSGVPFLSPGGLPKPGSEPVFLRSPALAGSFFTTSASWEASERFRLQTKQSQALRWLLCLLDTFPVPLIWLPLPTRVHLPGAAFPAALSDTRPPTLITFSPMVSSRPLGWNHLFVNVSRVHFPNYVSSPRVGAVSGVFTAGTL